MRAGKVRGSSWWEFPPVPAAPMGQAEDRTTLASGFRLVHEAGMSPVRGRPWSFDAAVSEAASYSRDGQLESVGLGFRLCSDGGGT